MKAPCLMIWNGGFSVLYDALSEPWMMTRSAIQTFRNAVCYDVAGATCTIVDVHPICDVTLPDRLLPWHQSPVRLELQPGPDLSPGDMRARIVHILQRDSEIADFLKMPVDEAIASVREAETPVALIEAAKAALQHEGASSIRW